MKRNFIYKDKIYPFDLKRFNIYSDYFSNINENSKNILLFSAEDFIDSSEESIKTFILFFQNQEIEITNSTAIPLNYLSIKFEISLLKQMTKEYITDHYNELINDFLSLDIPKVQKESNTSQYEDIISEHLPQFISDDRLLNFSISSLYRILNKYFISNQQENQQEKIFNFLLKCFEKQGKDASILFSLIKIDNDQTVEYFSHMIAKYHDNFDFRFVSSNFFQGVIAIINQQKELKKSLEKQQELLQKQMFLVFYNVNKLQLPNDIEVITEGQYSNFSFQNVAIPSTVKTIESKAFSFCKNLINITIPSSVQKIGSFVFLDCSLLRKVDLPSSLKSIEDGVFINCSSLIQVVIPSSLIKIGIESFRNCSSLKEISLPESVKNIGSFAFADCSSLESFRIPSSVKIIEKGTFYNCSSLKQITISSSLIKIGIESFRNCSSLKEISLPESVENIGSYAFADCSSLESFNIPSSVKIIEKGTFSNCSSMSHLNISSNLLEIEDEAFKNCKSLNELIIPSSLLHIGSNVFYGYSLIIKTSQSYLVRLIECNVTLGSESRILEKIKDLQMLLLITKVSSFYNKTKFELINQLGHIKELTIRKLNIVQTIVNEFLAQSTENINSNNTKFSELKTENIKLFETLIWYSQIKTILNKMNSVDEFYKNLLKLNNYEEMEFISINILTKLIQKTNSIHESLFTIKDKEKALYILNAHMIYKLLSIDKSFIDDPLKISKVINNYIKRMHCEKTEIEWIQQTVSLLSPDFCLQIPKFEPNDLIFLIANKSHSEYRNGPLLTGIDNLSFLKEIEKLKCFKFNSFRDAAESIGRTIYQKMISNENLPHDYKELVLAFNDQNNEVSRRIKYLFAIAQDLDNWTEQKLLFDDISFLTKDIINDQKIMNQYPSLVFWICKNQEEADQLIRKYKNYEPIMNQIPLWLLELRIKSSQSCIRFETKEPNKTTEIIENAILKYLTDSMQQNNDINFNWINILISIPQKKMINHDTEIVHNFFHHLSMDGIKLPLLMQNAKFSIMQDLISEIIMALLSNQSQKLFSSDLKDSEITRFLFFPEKYIQEKFQDFIQQSIISNKSMNELKTLLNSLDSYQESIQKLKDEIKNDQEQKNISFNQQLIKQKTNHISEIKSNIDKYNELVSILSEQNYAELIEKVNNLLYIQRHLKYYPEIFKDDEFNLVAIQCTSLKTNELIIRRNGNKISIKIPKTVINKMLYLHPGETIEREDNISIYSIEKRISILTFKYIKENIDFDSIASKLTIIKNTPVLLFGREYPRNSKDFIDDLERIYNSLKSINIDLFIFDISKFQFLENVYNQIDKNMKNIYAYFSDGSPSFRAQSVLQDEIANFLNTFHQAIKNTMVIKNELKPFMSCSMPIKLFAYNHDIPIVQNSQIKKQFVPKFSKILNSAYLSNPVIYISSEKTICCSQNKLKWNIQPIFPSLYRDPILLNIASNIKRKVTLEICNLSDPQYCKFITEMPNKNIDILQLALTPPQVTKEPEIIILNGEIKIQADPFEPLLLPFEIKLEIFPLKFRLHCIEYQMAEENQSFILYCNKIESNKNINFEFDKFYMHDQFQPNVDIELLDKNEAPKPSFELNRNKRNLSIFVPKIYNPSRCHFAIKIALSQNFIIQIDCDFIIVPIQFNENEELRSKISFIKLPEMNKIHECFIISENETPIPCDIKNKLDLIRFDELNSSFDDVNYDSSLPNIEFPKVLSIRNLVTFYLNCSNGAALLPSLIMKRSHMNLQDLELYFAKLLDIYINITRESSINRSILSSNVNSFIESFRKLFYILNRAGIDFKNMHLPYNLNMHKHLILENITYPNIFIPNLKSIEEEEEEKEKEEELNNEIYIQNLFKGQKILIVMLYDNRANKNINLNISPENLINAEDSFSVKEAVEYHGIEIEIVQNYKDAICKLIKQTVPGKCDYYATWVISGHQYDVPLADGGNQYLVDQFIDCLIKFWQNGGSVVLFANGDPFTFQVNLFLERIVFPNNMKSNLRVGGIHKGKTFLIDDITGKLNHPGTFNKSPLLFEAYQRTSLLFHIDKIYEGESISFVPDDKSIYSPFIPFMKDSENGICGLFYPGNINMNHVTGDIIIDCGYSKLFTKMDQNGSFRYVRNIAGWTAKPEINITLGYRPWDFRPKAVIFDLNESKKFNLQNPPQDFFS